LYPAKILNLLVKPFFLYTYKFVFSSKSKIKQKLFNLKLKLINVDELMSLKIYVLYEKNDFEVSKNLVRYKSENNFVRLSK